MIAGLLLSYYVILRSPGEGKGDGRRKSKIIYRLIGQLVIRYGSKDYITLPDAISQAEDDERKACICHHLSEEE